MEPVIVEHIEITPGVCGGRPRIAGTRIRVQDVVVWHEREGLSVRDIAARYPHLALADIYAALAYYHDHREAIERDLERDEQLASEMQKKTPSLVQAKLRAANAQDDSLPSG